MSKPLRIVQIGLGAIGAATARLALSKRSMHLVGAVDADPELAGRELSEVLHWGNGLDLRVEPRLTRSLAEKAEAAVLTTGSRFADVVPQLEGIARAGLRCVSSCEEMLFPWHRHAHLARRLDRLAKKQGVALVGTGVNPGFVMDTLALVMSGVAQQVYSIEVRRVVDLAQRRPQLQVKAGLGLSPEEFTRRARDHAVGHVGLVESVAFLADALNWKLEHIRHHVEPIVASRRVATSFLQVPRGFVAGMHQSARGGWHGMDRIRLDLQMSVAPENPRDEIVLEGAPRLRVVVPGGVRGDEATSAILLNTLPRLMEAEPGLRTMRELAPPRVVA